MNIQPFPSLNKPDTITPSLEITTHLPMSRQEKKDHKQDQKPEQALDQVVISETAYNRYQSDRANLFRSTSRITDPDQASSTLSTIRHTLTKDLKSTLYVHQIVPHTSVLNLITPPLLLSSSHHIQQDQYTEKAR